MKILFVCEGNINRSQMAETMLRKMRPDISVRSAGTLVRPDREGQKVDTETAEGIEAMRAIGFDMSGAVQHQLTPQMMDWPTR